MKNRLCVVVLTVALGTSLLLTACSSGSDAAAEAARAPEHTTAPAGAEPTAQLVRANFAVEGMTCGGCAAAAKVALRKLDGVQNAGAEYDEETSGGTAWALYDPAKVTPERMMEAIRQLGYTPTLIASQS